MIIIEGTDRGAVADFPAPPGTQIRVESHLWGAGVKSLPRLVRPTENVSIKTSARVSSQELYL